MKMKPLDHRIGRYLIYFCICFSGCTTETQAKKRHSKARLSSIVHALQSYGESNGSLPPSSFIRHGEPMHSWRTLIVPYVESNRFYNSYDLDSPWDSGRNATLKVDESELTQVRKVFCGNANNHNSTVFLILKKNGSELPAQTILPRFAGWTARSSSFNNKIVLVEVEKSEIHWMEPKDYYLEDILESASLQSDLRSLVIFNVETKETEYIVASQTETHKRLKSLASEN